MTINEQVESLLSQMTLDEKIGQLTQMSAKLDDVAMLKEHAKNGEVSSRVMASTAFAGNEEQSIAGLDVTNALQKISLEKSRLGIPLMDGWDIVHGCRVTFPLPLAQAASWCPALAEQACSIAADEMLLMGVHWTFAPMLDICRDPRWGRIVEGYGEDPYLCSQMAQASVYGFQGREPEKLKVAACAKHYIGYGLSMGGRDYNPCDCSEHELKNTYLPPFKAASEAGVATMMASFNEIGGEPVTGSYKYLTEILRGELGFEGFVVSDWYGIHQLINQGVAKDTKDAARLALSAGVDMDMIDNVYRKHIKELLDEGSITIEQVDTAVKRILRIKLMSGLFDNSYVDEDADKSMTSEHMAVAREFAEKCMVLLKNKEILPLDKNSGKKIAVVGPMAAVTRPLMGSWTQNRSDEGIVSVIEGIRSAAPNATILNSTLLYDEMLMTARRSDIIVLVLGESDRRNGEHSCVADITLPIGQIELLRSMKKLGKPIITIICSGRPVVMDDVDSLSDAVLYAWHCGHQTGSAVGRILFGDVNPSGKLPVTFPRITGQIPIFYNHKPNARNIDEYYYPEMQDYYDIPGSPMYTFGYGLSYTSFEYSEITLDKQKIAPNEAIKVSVTVTNTGNIIGDEIVQCYIHDKVALMSRPIRELKGFERISLKPGESKTVTFTLDKNSLSYYGPGGELCLEPGEFDVYVGSSCLTKNVVVFEVV